jgi:uncharacterized protein
MTAAPPIRRAPPASVEEGTRRVVDLLRSLRPGAIVALSGGSDSALVLDLAVEAWGRGSVVAATSRSESLAPEELEDARRCASAAGVEHLVLAGSELSIPAFRANAPDRCFHCKDHLFGQMRALADRRGVANLLDGTNADDLLDDRPGLAAAASAGVRSPLLEAGISKPWVRAISRSRGLFTWDKPAESCLSSRFPHGTEVTAEGLDRVRRAERALKDLGFRTVRVRVHDPVARVEVPPEDLPALLAPGVRERAIDGVKAAGFAFVALDLEGYRRPGGAS